MTRRDPMGMAEITRSHPSRVSISAIRAESPDVSPDVRLPVLLPMFLRRSGNYGVLASGSSLLSTVARSARRVIEDGMYLETLCQPEWERPPRPSLGPGIR